MPKSIMVSALLMQAILNRNPPAMGYNLPATGLREALGRLLSHLVSKTLGSLSANPNQLTLHVLAISYVCQLTHSPLECPRSLAVGCCI